MASSDAGERAGSIHRGLIRGYLLVLTAYYALVTPLNLTLPAPAVWPMFICTSLSALVSAITWRLCGGAPTVRRLEGAAAATNLILLFNAVLHSLLVGDAHLLIYFAPMAMIFSIMGPSMRVVLPSLAAVAGSALLCGHLEPQAYRSEFAFAVATSIMASIAMAFVLHRAIRQKREALATLQTTVAALEAARRESVALAEHAQAAHAAKARFVANMSHEIRNPLGGMLGLAAALARTPLDANQRETVALLESSGRMLKAIVSDVLDLEKVEAGKVELETIPFDLDLELKGVAALLGAQAQAKGLSLLYAGPAEGAPAVVGDPTRIKQIVINLLSNAIKFTATGEVRLRLTMQAAEQPGAIAATLEVEDTGIGFDEAAAARLFDRFAQADASTTRRFGGTGLGLSISRGLAELMQGTLTATSEPGRGSCFRLALTLPLASETSAAETAPEAGGGVARPLRVLVAEDNPAVSRVIALLLEQIGAEATLVDDGRAALDAHAATDFDVILMDMNMPEMDGVEAARAIRRRETEARTVATPIIMLTAHDEAEARTEAIAAGAAFVTKPIDPAALYAALDAATAAATLDQGRGAEAIG